MTAQRALGRLCVLDSLVWVTGGAIGAREQTVCCVSASVLCSLPPCHAATLPHCHAATLPHCLTAQLSSYLVHRAAHRLLPGITQDCVQLHAPGGAPCIRHILRVPECECELSGLYQLSSLYAVL